MSFICESSCVKVFSQSHMWNFFHEWNSYFTKFVKWMKLTCEMNDTHTFYVWNEQKSYVKWMKYTLYSHFTHSHMWNKWSARDMTNKWWMKWVVCSWNEWITLYSHVGVRMKQIQYSWEINDEWNEWNSHFTYTLLTVICEMNETKTVFINTFFFNSHK